MNAINKIDALRWKGFTTGLFPSSPVKVSGNRLFFSLAMNRKVAFDLTEKRWSECSDEGTTSGDLTESAIVRLRRLFA